MRLFDVYLCDPSAIKLYWFELFYILYAVAANLTCLVQDKVLCRVTAYLDCFHHET